MTKQILNEVIVENPFQEVADLNTLSSYSHVIIPIELYLEHSSAFEQFQGELGIRIGTDQDLALLVPILSKISLIEVRYDSFTDGRGHSLARLLREAYHYKGILRASGDVFKDTLYYLKRCGFNAFLVKESETLDHALQGLNVFTESYQAAVDQIPLFRRRVELLRI
ncbi:MAG: DUF934 domain-containing protein [Betaproteobacteria bacterium]|nr:DUF934 domain-containing protein [Betaproteobacteria bacterium]